MQSQQEFKQCIQLVKLLWNREFAAAWPVLRDAKWSDTAQPMAQQLESALQQRVVSFINKAYTSIRVDNACSLLGAKREDMLQGEVLGACIDRRGSGFTLQAAALICYCAGG